MHGFLNRARVASLGLMVVLSARAETWQEWEAPQPDAPLRAELRPGWDVETVSSCSRTSFNDWIEPNRGFEGTLVITPAPGAEPVKGPLTLRFLYAMALPDDLNWPEETIPDGFVLALRPGASLRKDLSDIRWVLPAEFPVEVPVVLPRNCRIPDSFRNHKPSALAGRYEISDAAGRMLLRGVLPLRKGSETSRILTGEDRGDEAMKRLTEKAGNIDRVGNLPNEMEAYRLIPGIWFTDSLWDKMEGREDLARRLLLSGMKFSGSTSLVNRICMAIGLGNHGRVLAGFVRPSTWSFGNVPSFRDLELPCIHHVNSSSTGREKSLLGNEVDLFAADRRPYQLWSLMWLGVCTLGLLLLLAIGFFRFKGERRVALWWMLPAWAVFCSFGIWIGGLMFLDRRPRADVTEYRLIMQGWPEMHCRTVASAMTFTPGRPDWILPPQACVYPPQYGNYLDGWWMRTDALHVPDEIRLQQSRKGTGSTLELEAGWFEPAAAPVSVENGTPENPGRWVTAREDLDSVFVRTDGKWHPLGKMKAGDRRDPLEKTIQELDYLPGLPSAIHDQLQYFMTSRSCGDEKKEKDPLTGLVQPSHDWVVVACREGGLPRVRPDWSKSITEGRVIWVMQCP